MHPQCRLRVLAYRTLVLYCSNISKCYCSATVPYVEYFFQNSSAKEFRTRKEVNSNRNGSLDLLAASLAQRFAYNCESKVHDVVKQWDTSYICDTSVEKNPRKFRVMEWNENNINNYLTSALNSSRYDEIEPFLIMCLEKKMLPARNLIMIVAVKCALKGEAECVKAIQKLCKSLDAEEYESQVYYVPYLAAAMWMQGNIEEAEKLFWSLYSSNQRLHGKVKYIMKFLITHAITRKGEAALVLSRRFAEKIHERFHDSTFLIYIWEHCILSDWFCDNQTACELLEDIPELQEAVAPLIPDLTAVALRQGKVDAAQRLCEVLLKYEKKEQICLALRNLFDYSCLRRDVRACLAIIESSRELNVSLTEAQHETFLLLFCNEDKMKNISRSYQELPLTLPKFNLKF